VAVAVADWMDWTDTLALVISGGTFLVWKVPLVRAVLAAVAVAGGGSVGGSGGVAVDAWLWLCGCVTVAVAVAGS
jgi:hypothetical protein